MVFLNWQLILHFSYLINIVILLKLNPHLVNFIFQLTTSSLALLNLGALVAKFAYRLFFFYEFFFSIHLNPFYLEFHLRYYCWQLTFQLWIHLLHYLHTFIGIVNRFHARFKCIGFFSFFDCLVNEVHTVIITF